jgi:8-oxo-dGTP diphosphatase
MRAVQRFEISLKAFIVRSDGRALILQEADTGFWELPGGRIDVGEEWQAFETTLLREISEELGPQFKIRATGQFVPFMRLRPTDGQHILQLARVCQHVGGEPKLSSEHADVRWLQEPEARDLGYPQQSNYRDTLPQLWALSRGL